MARRLRLPLLLALATLTTVLVLTPETTTANHWQTQCASLPPGSCSGHYGSWENIWGTASSVCNGNPPPYCVIGKHWFEWDCALQSDGSCVPQNVTNSSPIWCFCQPAFRACC